jgi:hypothetical protein
MNEQKETELLETLASAIYDVGYWSWWTSDLPAIFQVEFNGTHLYFPPEDKAKPPSGQIAIQFRNLKSVSFLTRQKFQIEMAYNWEEQLQNDEIEPFTCEESYFTFNDIVLMKQMIDEAKSIKTIYGYNPKNSSFQFEKARLVFWAGNAGLAISGEEMRLLNKDGWIELKDIPEINKKWWDYWQEYWKVINTDQALPKDYACEVTIPIKNEK